MRVREWFWIFLFIIVIIAGETFARTELFKKTSYYNYDAIDWQMEDFDKSGAIETVFIGSSEVRYGLDPAEYEAHSSKNEKTFNLGLDGMNLSYYRLLLPALLPKLRQHDVKTALVGINLAEDVVMLPTEPNSLDCTNQLGVLQRGVIQSPFGIDSGLDRMCRTSLIERYVSRPLSEVLYSVKQRAAFRKFLFNPKQRRQSRDDLHVTNTGFHVRPSAQSLEEVEADLKKWWDGEAHHDTSLSPKLWNEALEDSGLYSQLVKSFNDAGITPIFFSLPTNPKMIDRLNRRADYSVRSREFQSWASRRGVRFVDLGLADDFDPVKDFADRRHLSFSGAKKFSARLAAALK